MQILKSKGYSKIVISLFISFNFLISLSSSNLLAMECVLDWKDISTSDVPNNNNNNNNNSLSQIDLIRELPEEILVEIFETCVLNLLSHCQIYADFVSAKKSIIFIKMVNSKFCNIIYNIFNSLRFESFLREQSRSKIICIWTLAELFFSKDKYVTFIFQECPSIETYQRKVNTLGYYALHGNIQQVNRYILEGVNINHPITIPGSVANYIQINLPKFERICTELKTLPELLDYDKILIIAIIGGDADMIKLLIKSGAKVNLDYGIAPLSLALLFLSDMRESLLNEILNLLIESGANINFVHNKVLKIKNWHDIKIKEKTIKKGRGQTPLMLACKYYSPIIVKLLLDAGADPKLKDKKGLTAYDYANKNMYRRLIVQKLNNSSIQKPDSPDKFDKAYNPDIPDQSDKEPKLDPSCNIL